MTLDVDPEALRIYAIHLAGLQHAAQKAKAYVNKYGGMSVHEQGLIGKFAGYHDTYLAQVNATLDSLSKLLESSSDALKRSADNYSRHDRTSAAQIDESLPRTPEASPSRD
ncbi:hypothetical protein Acy02nite_02270 [Actinoplanes cyaneus]|uniref:ESX-1 secretion-associated protein n=1 Tax=Actinoplanes cyaneus TaxID=52696 RepID=A0A919M8U7_9ACTN|nr:type VII secretion target [Actinoplanes cyaneus]MCW2143566.1 Excreted virulence factor EspC, type VII ESX diderm [Actinoplanes cyaneus]GID62346.1 hypothetical protein Acy02nite_02270 [Actinoplanes cyaneus]